MNKRCSFCNATGFVWGQYLGGWRLFTKSGELHVCQARLQSVQAQRKERLQRVAALEGYRPAAVPTRERPQVKPQAQRCGRVAPSPAHMHARPGLSAVEWSGFKWTPLCQAIAEARSKYPTEQAVADTRRFNDLEVMDVANTSGPEFKFTE